MNRKNEDKPNWSYKMCKATEDLVCHRCRKYCIEGEYCYKCNYFYCYTCMPYSICQFCEEKDNDNLH